MYQLLLAEFGKSVEPTADSKFRVRVSDRTGTFDDPIRRHFHSQSFSANLPSMLSERRRETNRDSRDDDSV
jgi:hypothetical protein